MKRALRIALADDQSLVRHGLRAILEKLGDLQVMIDAADGEQLDLELRSQSVDVILADIRMPKCSGIELVRSLRSRGDQTPTILLTTFDDPALIDGATRAGAQAFLLKDVEPEELKAVIERVAAGEVLLSLSSLRRARYITAGGHESVGSLTERELAVLRLVASGYSNKEIGRALGISNGTVKNHLTEVLQKMAARDRTHAVMKAISRRLL